MDILPREIMINIMLYLDFEELVNILSVYCLKNIEYFNLVLLRYPRFGFKSRDYKFYEGQDWERLRSKIAT